MNQTWAQVALIVAGYLVAILYQTHHIDKRIDDLKDWIRSEVKRLEERIGHLEHARSK